MEINNDVYRQGDFVVALPYNQFPALLDVVRSYLWLGESESNFRKKGSADYRFNGSNSPIDVQLDRPHSDLAEVAFKPIEPKKWSSESFAQSQKLVRELESRIKKLAAENKAA